MWTFVFKCSIHSRILVVRVVTKPGCVQQGRTGTQFQAGKSHTHPGHTEKRGQNCTFWGTTACHWSITLKRTSNFFFFLTYLYLRVVILTLKVLICRPTYRGKKGTKEYCSSDKLLYPKKVQFWPLISCI